MIHVAALFWKFATNNMNDIDLNSLIVFRIENNDFIYLTISKILS
jgi:hypothetical protein